MYDINTLTELIKSESSTEEACSTIASDLTSGNLSMLKLIGTLGDVLTSQEVHIRRGGIEILSNVLEQLPVSLVNAKELEHLVGYFCTCLVDHHSFIPAILKGFLNLMKMDNVPDGVASKIFTVLNLHFTCQSQPQADRYVCYQLLNAMTIKKKPELQALGPDFVCGYLSFVDSERDPRNLMYLFECLPEFFQNFPPGHLLEDAFEAASCYFPVDFRTNPKDPRGITREKLSNALMPCLTAIHDFCPSTVALALDKLASDLIVAKSDSLLLLKRCINTFPPEKLCPLSDEITSSLLNELKPGLAEADVQELSIDVLTSLIRYLSKHKPPEEVNKILATVYSSVSRFLKDIHLSFFIPAVKFMARVASSCTVSCKFVIAEMVPKLLAFDSSCDSEITIILESFKLLLPACVTFMFDCSELNKLVDVWPRVPQLYLRHCESEKPELKILAIEGMTSIVQLFNEDERRSLYSILCQSIKYEENTVVRPKCIGCICTVACVFPSEVKVELDSKLTIKENGSVAEKELRKRIFHCWCSLAPVPGFVSYLDTAVKMYIVNNRYKYADFVIGALRNLVEREKNNTQFLNSLHHEVNITRHVMDWWHEGCNADSDGIDQVFENELTAENLQFIICIIIRTLDKTSQLEIANHYLQLTTDYSERFMNSFQYLNVNDDLSTPKVHCSLSMITFESIVTALLPPVLEQSISQYLAQIIKYLSSVAIFCSRPKCCLVACRSIATVFNKINEGPSREEHLEYVKTYILNVIEKENGLLKNNALNLLLYVTKSLLLLGYSELNLWLDKLLLLIMDKDVSNIIANGFRMISTEDEYFLNTSCHYSVKLFYRQRIFSYVIPRLVTAVKNVDQEVKVQCAVSAVYLLKELPQNVLVKYIKEIIPLLVELLDVNCDREISLTNLEKLTSLLRDNGGIFEEYIETFIPKLLILAQSAANMRVRLVALQCLTEYSKLNLIIILPFKTRVVHGLTPCIDDRKRLVRKEAVKARTRWVVLGIE